MLLNASVLLLKVRMTENDKLKFLNSCGIFLKKQVQKTPEKKAKESRQLAVIQKWHTLAQHCIKLWNGYSADYTLRPRDILDTCCPLCESRMKTVSLKILEEHVCLADNVSVKLKRIPCNFEGTSESFLQRSSCVSSKTKLSKQAQKVEPVLRLQRNVRTLGKVLAIEGPEAMVQLCSSVPTIRTKRIEVEPYTKQIEMLENLVSSGYLKVLAKLAREKEEERKQAEKREQFARKSLTINIERNDLERLQGSPADAIISTPVQTSKLINVLPLSAGRATKTFFQPSSPDNYRKTLWPNRKCLDSPGDINKNELAETPNSKSSASDSIPSIQQLKVPVQRLDLSNFELDQFLISSSRQPEKLFAANNFSSNGDSVTSNSASSHQNGFISDDNSKEQIHRREKRQLEKPESCEEIEVSPAKKTRKTERAGAGRRPQNGMRGDEDDARKVQFTIDATPENSSDAGRSNIKYKPCYRTLNGQNVLSKLKSSKSASLCSSTSHANTLKGCSRFLAKKLIAESLAGLRSGNDLPPNLVACVKTEKSAKQRRHSQPSDSFVLPRPEFRAFIHLKSPAKCFNHANNKTISHSTSQQNVATVIRSVETTPAAMKDNESIKSPIFISKTSPYNIFQCAQLNRMLADNLLGTPGHAIDLSDDDEVPEKPGLIPDDAAKTKCSPSRNDTELCVKQPSGNNEQNRSNDRLYGVRDMLGERENPFTLDSEDDSGRSTPKAYDDETISRENITPPHENPTTPTKSSKCSRAIMRRSNGRADKAVHKCGVNRSNNVQILNFSNSGNKIVDEQNVPAKKSVLPANITFDQSYFSLSEDNYSTTESDEVVSGPECTSRRSRGSRRRSKPKKDSMNSSTSGVGSDQNSKGVAPRVYDGIDNNTLAEVNRHSNDLKKGGKSSFHEPSFCLKSTSADYKTSPNIFDNVVDKDISLNMSPILTKGDPFLGENSCSGSQQVSPQFVIGGKTVDSNWNISDTSKLDNARLRKPCHLASSKDIQCASLPHDISESESEVFANLSKSDFIASPSTLFESI